LSTYQRNIVRLGPVYVIGVWNPFGRPVTLEENEGLADSARVLGSVRAELLSFGEKAVVWEGATQEAAVHWAEFYGQPAYLVWDGRGISVCSLAGEVTLSVPSRWDSTTYVLGPA
jgi:hypothetical protein